MSTTAVIFWTCLLIVCYTYLGYGLLLFFLVRIKRLFNKKEMAYDSRDEALPEVTFIVAAYNEEDWIVNKLRNSLELDYPARKIAFWFVTDGSTDRTQELIAGYRLPAGKVVKILHSPERRGKIAAIERVMPMVETPVTIYTDANTSLNRDAVKNIVRHYQQPEVGAVAGEKRISLGDKGDATGAGEGIYWKYESKLKTWDSELNSVIGAAGELFSIRTDCYEHVPRDTYIEDFVMTMRIAQKGFKVVYEPEAYAVEGQSASIGEELKRKIRIAAGGLQAAWRLRSLLNPFRYGLLTFQYVSHRLLRWTLAPLALPVLFMTNVLLASTGSTLYQLLLTGQVLFYAMALTGHILAQRKLKVKVLFVPYYFCIMNYAMYRGFFRLLAGRQSVVWEKAKRAV